ncbi:MULTISPECIES: MFS transporter [Pseudomonas]|uniref:MFS transporter n=1 Tax=Pseudomonas TaxID=286 RepID=UPI000D9059F2|nr:MULTISPECIES: MFS transporter [Pseudomonas]MDP9691812.1 MFS family permease [Pseudomonas mohnii]MBD0679184.1 MFS transporter [Pseudomonas sp. PSB11]MCK8682204.1 MFS transporter [Pseudomonas umsongensis]MDI3393821.1 MFS transporter [Pseudomonas sp. V98_8]NWL22142.1 MFS transporter [Pseudomonas umsongensis]
MSNPRTTHWPAPVRALANRNFQIYFVGQGISTLGKWVQQVALAWLAYHLTGSAILLGLITFLSLAPQLLIGPLAGAWIDRHDKRRLLIGVQVVLVLQSLTLAVITQFGWIDGTSIAAMALLLGLLNAVETPLRQALIGSFVDDPADLPNALVLNAMLINAARFIGPPLAGTLIAVTNEAGCFLLTAFAYLGLMAGLLKVKATALPKATGSTSQVFREGVAYLWHTVSVRQLMISVVMVNLLASCYAALLPILAKTVYAGDARILGWLWGAAGAGAFVATLILAFSGSLSRLRYFTDGGALVCGFALLGVFIAADLPLALFALVLLGFGITMSNVSTNMQLQSGAPSSMRGRVIAFYIAMRFGFEAVGGMLAGLVAARYGAPATLGIAGGILLVYLIASIGGRGLKHRDPG